VTVDVEAKSSRDLVAEYWRERGEADPGALESRLGYISDSESKYREQISGGGGFGLPGNESGRRSCLELGCGPGAFLLAAAERFEVVVGIDISLPWLVIARKRFQEWGRRAVLVCACAERLPFRDREFDLVGFFDAIEHVADGNLTVQEVCRVTRQGGR